LHFLSVAINIVPKHISWDYYNSWWQEKQNDGSAKWWKISRH